MNDVHDKLAEMSNKVSREKYWEECDAEQKIERLRDQLATACRLIEQQSQILNSLAVHRHGQDGVLLTPLYANGRAEGGAGYFAHDRGIPHSLRLAHQRR